MSVNVNANVERGEVKSARRVLEILRFFVEEKGPATLARISSALGFPKSSCLALLDTLEAEGYAYHIDGRYYLTRRWQQEGQIVADHDQLSLRFRPILEALQSELQETLILAQRSFNEVVYLDVVEGGQVLRFAAHPGQKKPLHASASGRALLSPLDDAELLPLLEALPYERHTDATPGTPKQLLAIIRKERKRGWHVNLGEYQSDTISVAAPVVMHGLVLALVVGAPMSRARNKIEAVGSALAAAAARALRDF